MFSNLTVLLFIAQIHRVFNESQSHHPKRSPLDQKVTNDLPSILIPHENHLPIITPLLHPNIPLITVKTPRKKKGPNIPLSVPIPHQLLVPTKLHVIPARSNIHHSSIHTDIKHLVTKDNIQIPVISQTVSHSVANITHPTPLIPVLIPLHHNHLVPVHDLSVIPLQRSVHKAEAKISHLRSSEKKDDEDDDPMDRYRSFYGGYGSGLYFGGHGAGHGYYAYYG